MNNPNTDEIYFLFFIILVLLLLFRTNRKVDLLFYKRNSNKKSALKVSQISFKKELQKEIRNILNKHTNSIQIIKKYYTKTGTLQHELLKSITENVKNQLKFYTKLKNIPETSIDRNIEIELLKLIEDKKSILKRLESCRQMIFKKVDNYRTFLRIFPGVTVFSIIMILIHIATYYYGRGPTDIETAIKFGAVLTRNTDPEEWYRLVTSIFLHNGGTYHLLSNIVSLIIFGPPLERFYGPIRFSFLFLLTGISSSIFVIFFSDYGIVAGASGSIFGLLGLYVGLVLQKYRFIDYESKMVIIGALVVNLVYTFTVPNISIAGHIGGLISGLFLSFLFSPQSYQSTLIRRPLITYAKVLLTTSLCFLFFLTIPKYINPSGIYGLVKQLPSQFSWFENEKGDDNMNEGPTVEIISFTSGVIEGWIDTTNQFFDELTLSVEVHNTLHETIDIYPEMFVLSDSGGYTPHFNKEKTSFQFIPLPPNEKVKITLHYSVSLKKTTGDFLFSVSGWKSYDKFIIQY